MIQIEQIHGQMSSELQERLAGTWGSSVLVTRGRKHDMSALKGFIARDEATGRLAGIALFRADPQELELVALESIFQRRGVGTRLLDAVTAYFRTSGHNRLCLCVTNDNVNAIRFYQKRGFNLCALHKNSIPCGLGLNPAFRAGYDGIQVRHELEFELLQK